MLSGNTPNLEYGRQQKVASQKKGNGRTIEQINQKIKSGDVQVVTAEEMRKLWKAAGWKSPTKKWMW
jgi:hypothetical protein